MSIRVKSLSTEVTYDQYVCALEATFIPGRELAFSVPPSLAKFLGQVKDFVTSIKNNLGVAALDVVRALSTSDVFKFLKAVGFNLAKVFTAIQKLAGLVKQGLIHAFERAEKEGWLNKLKQGTAAVDDFLEEYPIIKKLAGPLLGALLLYALMNGAFMGNVDHDLDVSMAIAAFAGNYSVEAMLATPDGLATLTVAVFGLLTGISVTYCANTLYTTFLALVYTGAKKANLHELAKQTHDAIKRKVHTAHVSLARLMVPAQVHRNRMARIRRQYGVS